MCKTVKYLHLLRSRISIRTILLPVSINGIMTAICSIRCTRSIIVPLPPPRQWDQRLNSSPDLRQLPRICLIRIERWWIRGRTRATGVTFEDIASGGLGRINFTQALAGSSDGYFYRVADQVGHARLREFALAFGLGARSGIDIPGEYAGLWPTNAWSMATYHVPLEPSDVCQLGIGQGAMEATPLQMADVTSVIANGGNLYQPHILKDIVLPDGNVIMQPTGKLIRRVPISPEAVGSGSGRNVGRYRTRGLPQQAINFPRCPLPVKQVP